MCSSETYPMLAVLGDDVAAGSPGGMLMQLARQVDRQVIEDGCGNAMDQTHASNHPVTGTGDSDRNVQQTIKARRVADRRRIGQ